MSVLVRGPASTVISLLSARAQSCCTSSHSQAVRGGRQLVIGPWTCTMPTGHKVGYIGLVSMNGERVVRSDVRLYQEEVPCIPAHAYRKAEA